MTRFHKHSRTIPILIAILSCLAIRYPARSRFNPHAAITGPSDGLQTRIPGTFHDGQQKDVLQSRTELVTFDVSVTDKHNRYIAGLTPEDFHVYENGIEQNLSFFADDDSPLNIGILLDTSKSLKKYFPNALEAARELIRASHPEDVFFFQTFARQLRVLAEFADGETIMRKLHLPEPVGATAIYDSIYYAVEKVKEGKHQKNALFIISDGQENASRYDHGELIRLVKEMDVQIYCIGIGDTSDDGNYYTGEPFLADLAEITGGKAFFPRNAADLQRIANQIALLLRHQYSIGYYPDHSPRNKSWCKLQVRLRPSIRTKNLRVTARSGYSAQ